MTNEQIATIIDALRQYVRIGELNGSTRDRAIALRTEAAETAQRLRAAPRTPAACISEATPNATTVAALQEAEIARLTALVENMRASLNLAYVELKQHAADYHHRTSTEINNKIVDALGLSVSSTMLAPEETK